MQYNTKMLSHALNRFFKYSVVGVSTFALDLFLLFLLIDIFHWNYLVATGGAFIVAISLNYLISRNVVFKYSVRSLSAGYISFLLISGIGLLLVVAGMYVFVEMMALNYIVSRIFIAGFVGIWNYSMNLYVNFKVAGIH